MSNPKRQRQKQGRQARIQAEMAAARRSSRTRRIVAAGLAAVLVLGLLALFATGGDDETDLATDTTEDTATSSTTSTSLTTFGPECPPTEGTEEQRLQFTGPPGDCLEEGVDYAAVITTSKGDFTVDLLEDGAPLATNNFVFLSRWNYFDGDDFHRVVQDFVIQGGDPVGDPPGTGGPGYSFADELPEGTEAYVPGVLAMANSGADTNGSQWFVYTGPNPMPVPNYTIFGRVTEGMDVVEAIQALALPDQTPSEPVTIDDVEIVER